MGKKIILLFVLTFLSATILSAQISMKGQLQRFFNHDSFCGLVHPFGEVIENGIALPTVKPKTKSVIIKRREMEYDHFNEEWPNSLNTHTQYYEGYKVVYDTLGKIDKIFYHYGDSYSLDTNYNIIYDHYDFCYIIAYDGDRLKKILIKEIGRYSDSTAEDYIKIIYNQSNHVTKILLKDDPFADEVRVKWNSQGFLSQYQRFRNGEPCGGILWPSTTIYQVTQKGRNIIETIGTTKKQIILDEQYSVKRYGKTYYENIYDINNNLIQQVQYEFRNGEKYYTNGCYFEYEYEFYE